MPHRSLIMAGWSVRAILEDRKSVTRRLLKHQPFCPCGKFVRSTDKWIYGPKYQNPGDTEEGDRHICPHHKGDIVYVTEAWRTLEQFNHLPPRDLPRDAPISYFTFTGDGHWPYADNPGRKRSPRFMCKWMSRLWLRVPGEPYPERVRDITEAESIREGCQSGRCEHGCGTDDWPELHQTAVDEFQCMWSRLHGLDSLGRGWVWRIPLERTEAPHG